MRRKSNLSSDHHIDRINSRLGRIWEDVNDHDQIEDLVAALDTRYQLRKNLIREEGLQEVREQMDGRIVRAFERIYMVHGKRMVGIASGLNTRRGHTWRV